MKIITLIERIKNIFAPNLRDVEGKTVLLLAAKIRNAVLLKTLLAAFHGRIDVNLPDNKKRTPLHFACALGDVDAIQALLAANADVNAKDCHGQTPLDYANAKPEVIEELLRGIEIHPGRDIKATSNAVLNFERRALYHRR